MVNHRINQLMLVCVALGAVWLTACSEDDQVPEEAFEGCSVLSAVQASSGSSISGNVNMAGLEDYSIDASTNANVAVTPPANTPCALEIASKLQGLCAVCEQSSEQACEEAVTSAFDISKSPVEACAACGDGACSPGESAVEGDGDNTFCPEDCNRSQCGDDVCQGRESFSCAAGTTEETCVACPQDCSNPCGDGTCDPLEDDVNCPQDCGTACGDGVCERGESANPEDATYCPQDCRSTCGDRVCQPDETVGSCPGDCQECGDRICSDPDSGGTENTNTCPIDCDTCGDGTCGRSEVLDDEDADPDNADPLARMLACSQDCWVSNDGVCSPGEPVDEVDCGE